MFELTSVALAGWKKSLREIPSLSLSLCRRAFASPDSTYLSRLDAQRGGRHLKNPDRVFDALDARGPREQSHDASAQNRCAFAVTRAVPLPRASPRVAGSSTERRDETRAFARARCHGPLARRTRRVVSRMEIDMMAFNQEELLRYSKRRDETHKVLSFCLARSIARVDSNNYDDEYECVAYFH